ncbi:MAG: hypothetical protein EB127_26110, partial [Alphaproteobacteria bacterium]|nr:hypothetical protein [Alphaproteobacteria bacterium]
MKAHFKKYNGNRDYLTTSTRLNKSLVIYTYFASPSSDYNLTFYSKMAITESANTDYIIVVNGHTCNVVLPKLPNLKVIYRDNVGFDFGGHKAALDSLHGKEYEHYFFMNSGVLGPFLPENHPTGTHWTELFIKKITDKVKLVGTCIMTNPIHGPLIEGFCFMTDHIGLKLLLNKQTIFFDHKTKVDAIHNGEMSVAKCIFDANYTIDCMLKKYQGVDWLKSSNWSINNYESPSRRGKYFGVSIDPFEVVFHKWYWHNPADSMVSFDVVEKYVNKAPKSLVVYTYFASTSSDYNLDFYSKTAISENANIDYIIVVNGHTCNVVLPKLSNLKVIYRDNVGFDFGGHKAALDSLHGKQYDYYFFMNSGVLGPFLPDTHPKDTHWTELFIKKITDKVKLVGTSIYCVPNIHPEFKGPRVEGFFFMTDNIGLSALLDQKTIFYNHTSKEDAIHHGEYGLTECIMKRGYTIDCMLE